MVKTIYIYDAAPLMVTEAIYISTVLLEIMLSDVILASILYPLLNTPSPLSLSSLLGIYYIFCYLQYISSGIAGASYIPTIQEALPRLIGAAAPPGSGANENRRQCHKVNMLVSKSDPLNYRQDY